MKIFPSRALISALLIITGFIFGLFGLKAYWRDQAYVKASTVVRASVQSAEVKPMSGKAVAGIRLFLVYRRDGVADSTAYNFTTEYSDKKPLPAEAALKAQTYYVRYVPMEKRSKNIPNWVMINGTGEFEGLYGRAKFGQMFTFILLGLMLRWLTRKRPVQEINQFRH